MIFKGGKGKKEELASNRFIHSKTWLPRLAEGLVVEAGLKAPLLANSSRYQVGGQEHHRAEELLFCKKSIMAKNLKEGRIQLSKFFDISKYFDRESLVDTMDMMYRREVDPKACRLWAKLNLDTRVRVRTGAGTTDWGEVGPCVGQGTIGGALASQASLDDGIMEQFHESQEEVSYGAVEVLPILFQDDISHDSTSLLDARVANFKLDMVMKTKQLSLNRDKTVLVVLGKKEQKEQITKELLLNPLMCGSFEMKEVESEKWLGDYISSGGLGASVLATIEAREGKVKGACMEVAAIIEDWRAQVAGGFESGLMLWETCCLPSLLHNAGTWVEMPAAAVKKLNSLQGWFLRLLLRQGPGVPSSSLLWESSCLDMELRVWLAKVMMILHIRGLKEDSLARQVWKEQRLMAWLGLALECDIIAEKLSIENANET